MGCCMSKGSLGEPLVAPDDVIEEFLDTVEPVDPLETRFNGLYGKGDGVIPTSDLAKSMGVSAITMGRMVTKWGYQLGRRYVEGKRLRVVIGLVPK